MPKRGENIYKRKDGRWEGRYKKYELNGSVKNGGMYMRSPIEKLNINCSPFIALLFNPVRQIQKRK